MIGCPPHNAVDRVRDIHAGVERTEDDRRVVVTDPRPAHRAGLVIAGLEIVDECGRLSAVAGDRDRSGADGAVGVRWVSEDEVRRALGDLDRAGRAVWWGAPRDPRAAIRHDGRGILVAPNRPREDSLRRLRSLAPLASLLQGHGVLHASAVRRGRSVAAFVGASGVGKSTLAEQLESMGWPVVAADVLPCRLRRGHPTVPLATEHGRGRLVRWRDRTTGGTTSTGSARRCRRRSRNAWQETRRSLCSSAVVSTPRRW